MSVIHRNLVSLEMLADDLADELGLIEKSDDKYVTANYCRLLQQYHQHSLCLEASAIELTGREFSDLMVKQGVSSHLTNKNALKVQNHLLGFVIQYYQATSKLEKIRHVDFSEHAETKFDLLTTQAIKHKAQYKTIAKELREVEYNKLLSALRLPSFDWQWDVLF
jgi:hypothetical protein